MLERGHYATDMRVGFCIDQTGIAVACAAPNAWAVLSISFIEHHSKRRVKRVQAKARKIVAELLNARLVTDCRIRKCPTAVRLSGIFPVFAMHMI